MATLSTYIFERYMSATIQTEPLLGFHGKAERLYCLRDISQQHYKGNCCYVSMAPVVMRLRHHVALNALSLSCSFKRGVEVLPIHLLGKSGLGLNIKRNGRN